MNRKDNIMIDLETLGVCADALVLSIGAVSFSFDGDIGNEFEIYPTVQDQIGQRKIEWKALKFWFEQNDDVRNQQRCAFRDKTLKESLLLLDVYCEENLNDNFRIWGNGFDVPLLNQAYSYYNLETPWSYKKIMDCRTAVYFSKISVQKHIDKKDLRHDAVSDCKFQIRFVVDAYKVLNGF